jgi:hypothetical protein
MAFAEMFAKCSWAKREQWCGCVDCHCQIDVQAQRRPGPGPTRDKIDEAFKRGD